MSEKTARVAECEYCGRVLSLVVEDKFCQELCRVAEYVRQTGYVMCLECGKIKDLITNGHLRVCSKSTREKYRSKFTRAIFIGSISSERISQKQ